MATQNDSYVLYIHHFNYLIRNVEEEIEPFIDKYTEIVGIKPDIMRFKETNLLYVIL